MSFTCSFSSMPITCRSWSSHRRIWKYRALWSWKLWAMRQFREILSQLLPRVSSSNSRWGDPFLHSANAHIWIQYVLLSESNHKCLEQNQVECDISGKYSKLPINIKCNIYGEWNNFIYTKVEVVLVYQRQRPKAKTKGKDQKIHAVNAQARNCFRFCIFLSHWYWYWYWYGNSLCYFTVLYSFVSIANIFLQYYFNINVTISCPTKKIF